MKNRLIIVEGLPSSGKSTASAFAADTLKVDGRRVLFADEGSCEHPADYEFHGFITDDELAQLTDDERIQITMCGEKKCGGYVVPLSRFYGKLFDMLLQRKIYDFLPWEREMPLMLDKWREFCESSNENVTYVFNCVMLQNPMCETMMRFGFDEQRSAEYIGMIADAVKPMCPLVIYLKNSDPAASVKRAAAEREGWLDGVIDYHVNGAYGKSIGAQGFDGYIACLEERQRRELRILQQLNVESLVIDDPQNDWDKAYDRIKKAII